MMYSIKINNLSYNIGDKSILEKIFLKVKENQFIGLVGPNGSGKTSIIRHIYRALSPEKHTVFINGKAIENYSYREAAKEITVMRQESIGEFDYSVLDMVIMGRSPHKSFYEFTNNTDRKAAKAALSYVGMSDYIYDSFCNLSGGEKQRVLIARSLVQEAKIILLDEPTNHLDIHYQWRILQLIKDLNKTTFSVFHDLNMAINFCDYIYVLKAGKIVASGAPLEIITSQLLEDVFRVKAQIVQCANGNPQVVCYGAVV